MKVMPNTKIPVKGISEQVIVCGDPGRARLIGEMLTDAKEVSCAREYVTINGYYNDTLISVISHGVGASGAAVCFEEAIKAGAKKIIRVGTAGSYVKENPPGNLLIADSAVREEGVTYQLVPKGMPAVGDFALVRSLEKTTKKYTNEYKCGTVVTLDAFYSGAVEFPHLAYKNSGALGAEMELAALYVIARMRGVAAAGIFALDGYAYTDMDDYNPHTDKVKDAVQLEIKIALETLAKQA